MQKLVKIQSSKERTTKEEQKAKAKRRRKLKAEAEAKSSLPLRRKKSTRGIQKKWRYKPPKTKGSKDR